MMKTFPLKDFDRGYFIGNFSKALFNTNAFEVSFSFSGKLILAFIISNNSKVSSGILFGSLCSNVTNIISYIPQTILKNAINEKYSNIKNINGILQLELNT